MKTFYKGLTIVLVFSIIFNLLVTIGIPQSEYIAAKLADNPELVSIDASQIYSLNHISSEDIHKQMIKFLNDNRNNSNRHLGYATVGIAVCLAFSIIGWVRERKFLREMS